MTEESGSSKEEATSAASAEPDDASQSETTTKTTTSGKKESKSKSAGATLADMFKQHASKSSGAEATSADISKWCKDAGVVSKTCDSGHVDISFTKVKQKTAKNITFDEMEALISELATKYKDDHKLDEETAKEHIAHMLTKTKPKAHGTTKTAKGGATGRLTDVKGYTGSHKERFDAESGKGKGKEGRVDVTRNTGYVGNYKNEGSHGKKTATHSSGSKKK